MAPATRLDRKFVRTSGAAREWTVSGFGTGCATWARMTPATQLAREIVHTSNAARK